MPRAKGPPGAFRLLLCPEGGTERVIELGCHVTTARGAKCNVKRWAADVGVRGHVLVQERQGEDFTTFATAHVKDSELTRWEYP